MSRQPEAIAHADQKSGMTYSFSYGSRCNGAAARPLITPQVLQVPALPRRLPSARSFGDHLNIEVSDDTWVTPVEHQACVEELVTKSARVTYPIACSSELRFLFAPLRKDMAPSQRYHRLYSIAKGDGDSPELEELSRDHLAPQDHPVNRYTQKVPVTIIALLVFSNIAFAGLWLRTWLHGMDTETSGCVRPQLTYCEHLSPRID